MKDTRIFCALTLTILSTLLLAISPAHAAPGDLDTFNPGAVSGVHSIALQPDGKIMVGGNFITLGGAARRGIGRLNANGTSDSGFLNSALQSGAIINCLGVQPDGKIVIGGPFLLISTTLPGNFDRLNANGSLDTNFYGGVDYNTYCMAFQADGKILVGGTFTLLSTSPTNHNRVGRVNPADGTADESFNPNVNSDVESVAVQSDGKILIGGLFTTVGGTTHPYLARVTANGVLDTTFNPNPGSEVHTVAVQPDGKILLGGFFTTMGGVTRNRIARVNADGTLDTGFVDPNANDRVYCVAVQTDGKILIGGNFTSVGGVTRNHIARLNADGTLDTGFDPNANNTVNTLTVQADGMVLAGGTFTTLQPNGAGAATTRNSIARLLNDPATQTLSVPDTAHIIWSRSGAGPELVRATFELSTDGGTTWGTPLAATRIGTTANWQLSGGISLPTSGQIRARGVTTSGYYTSAGLIEQVVSFSGLGNAPEIGVSGNGVNIPAGDVAPSTADFTDFGAAALGATTVVRTFTIANTGTAALNLTGTPKVVVSGPNAADFVVTSQPTTPVAATSGTSTFQVTFTPGAEGVRSATLSVASDDGDENPFNFAVTGRGLSFTTDTDGDGLSDASELMGAALGFNWQVSQPALVQTYFGMANGAGLYTAAQVQALHVGAPMISQNQANGMFKLTLSLQKATSLSPPNWLPFPFIGANTSVNAQGQLEYQFTSPDNAAFYLLQAQ
jgi:uncharacterized delta-60 repeat protein